MRTLAALISLNIFCACGPGKADTDTPPASCPSGGELPAVGSPCEEESVLCVADAGTCENTEARLCKAGVWTQTMVVPAGCEDPTGGATSDASSGSSGGMAVPCGPSLPPEGSACATPGEDCAPDADACLPYVGARCTDGVWTYYEVGPGDPNTCQPSCDPFPMDGQACSLEGASCSTGCEDQCEFCNIVRCEMGVWQNLEVFPAPCLDCPGICEFTVIPMCPLGPPDEAACVAGCLDGMAQCKLEFSDVLACAGEMPSFTCNAEGRPLVGGCEAQFVALYACLGL